MRIAPEQLFRDPPPACYLYGSDADAVTTAAERLMKLGDPALPRIRADCDELHRIHEEWHNPALFGPSGCIGLVRNAEAATPAQTARLIALVREVPAGSRLIIRATGTVWKRAAHKKLLALKELACCECAPPTPAQFRRRLEEEAERIGLRLEDGVVEAAAERLGGMEQAAGAWLQRLAWYDGGAGAPIPWSVAGALLGEQAPAELEQWCHAVADKSPDALVLLRRLVVDQRIAPIQMIVWLATRMQQILLYRWHQHRGGGNPTADLFGAARHQVPREARRWSAAELSTLLPRIRQAEEQLKGARHLTERIILERLVLELIAPDRQSPPG
ncbi:MAG: hypothetical protein D6682_07895 [Zetaproteobacteria bacterium]|nr:MAG: hypothetical protein D6682_07895 [Zetaproteobacteria bacterium]